MAQPQQTVHPLTDFLTGLMSGADILAKSTSYCGYIAERIRDALKSADLKNLISDVGPLEWDLHEKHGYSLSTSKFVELTDRNGNRYRITVEDIGPHNEKPLTSAERQMIRDALTLAEGSDREAKALAERFKERR